jgi:hypothetical protein
VQPSTPLGPDQVNVIISKTPAVIGIHRLPLKNSTKKPPNPLFSWPPPFPSTLLAIPSSAECNSAPPINSHKPTINKRSTVNKWTKLLKKQMRVQFFGKKCRDSESQIKNTNLLNESIENSKLGKKENARKQKKMRLRMHFKVIFWRKLVIRKHAEYCGKTIRTTAN